MTEQTIQICAFCSKKKADVDILVTGNSGNICNSCIDQASSIVKQEFNSLSNKKIKQKLKLLKPIEIKTYLDQYRRLNPIDIYANPVIQARSFSSLNTSNCCNRFHFNYLSLTLN